MFEAINSMTPKVNGGEAPSSQVIPFSPGTAAGGNIKPADSALTPMEQATQSRQRADQRQQREEETRQVTEEMLKELEQDIEVMHNIGLKFAKHNDTGRTMIKVLDKVSDELIREIPSEEVLNLAAKIEEMIGILFDKKV